MNNIPYNKRFCPHNFQTKLHAVKTYRNYGDVNYICRKYHISKASLMRWNKKYDGTNESLLDKSHRPKTKHPNSHTELELHWIECLHRRNPNISVCEMYGKLRTEYGYSRHYGSLYRIFVKLHYRRQVESTKKKYIPKPYNTPTNIGIKWQMDVKYVPSACYVSNDPQKFYQYTILDEASRERFIYPYMEQNSFSTVDFVQRAIKFFGYKPKIIQTDNGSEFTNFSNTKRIHWLDKLCKELNIEHKLIKPRTPRHNGKVERSHKNDQQRFYNFLKFYSYQDLFIQMRAYLSRSNKIPMQILGWKTPTEKRNELINKFAPLPRLY